MYYEHCSQRHVKDSKTFWKHFALPSLQLNDKLTCTSRLGTVFSNTTSFFRKKNMFCNFGAKNGHFQPRGQGSTMDLKADAQYVLSGGMGALGMVTAEYLLEVGTAGQETTCLFLTWKGGDSSQQMHRRSGTQCKPRSWWRRRNCIALTPWEPLRLVVEKPKKCLGRKITDICIPCDKIYL